MFSPKLKRFAIVYCTIEALEIEVFFVFQKNRKRREERENRSNNQYIRFYPCTDGSFSK